MNDYLEDLKKVGWSQVQKVIYSIGPALNSRKLLFDKSEFLELAVGYHSNNLLNHIDEMGCDFNSPKYNFIGTELKYKGNALTHKKDGRLREFISPIQLNKMRNGGITLPDYYADNIVIIDQNAAVHVTKEVANKYVISSGGGVQLAGLPLCVCNLLFHNALPTYSIKAQVGSNYVQAKKQAILDAIVQLEELA